MRRADVVKHLSVYSNRLSISLRDTEGMYLKVESADGFTLKYIMQLLYTACDIKQVICLTDGSRILIENRAYKGLSDDYIGSVTIEVKDPLFGRIFCQRYSLTADDEEKYNKWLEKRNNDK